MLFMIVENFKNENAKPVYKRFQEKGRLAPVGLKYISSWVDEELKTCFQLMETDDKSLLDAWMDNWKDIVDFEVFPVINSEKAAEIISKQKD